MEYKPINYNEWILGDRARQGANLSRLGLLDSDEWKIYQEALPYQDRRNDPGQAEIVTYFALELLKHLPGDRKVVVPSAILHDIGFYYGDSASWVEAAKKGSVETEEYRRPHQNRGVMLAGTILERVGHDSKYLCEIADIIGDHDTRRLPTTESGRVMRAADLIWRTTYPCMRVYFPDSNFEDALGRIKKSCLDLKGVFELGEIEREIAIKETVNTLMFSFARDEKSILEKII